MRHSKFNSCYFLKLVIYFFNRSHYRMVSCTRWTELVESLKFHIDASRATGAPSEFRSINGGPPIMVGTEDEDPARLTAFFENWPNGRTPLCRHVKDIIGKIEALADELTNNGQKACIVIITDGEATDGNLLEAMRPLNDLPVWIVVLITFYLYVLSCVYTCIYNIYTCIYIMLCMHI